MSTEASDRCPHCGGRADAGAADAPCARCRSEFVASIGRQRARWRALERRLRIGLVLAVTLGLLFFAQKAWYVAWVAWSPDAALDDPAFLDLPMRVFFRVASRTLLISIALVGIWMDANTWRLPRTPFAGATSRFQRIARTIEWIPGATLALACLVNFLLFAIQRDGSIFLAVVCMASLLTAASAAVYAHRIRDFDRFRAGCTGARARIRFGSASVWVTWILLAAGCWLIAMQLRAMGPFYDGFDARTVRAVPIASAVVWFIELASVRRALRRWSDG